MGVPEGSQLPRELKAGLEMEARDAQGSTCRSLAGPLTRVRHGPSPGAPHPLGTQVFYPSTRLWPQLCRHREAK